MSEEIEPFEFEVGGEKVCVTSHDENYVDSVASASADAEMGFEKYFDSVNEQYYYRRVTLDIHNREPWRELAHNAYLAGHAARQGEVDQLRADLEAMCGEVERCWKVIEGLYAHSLADCGIYRDDEQTRDRFNESMERCVRSKRPARVTAILAARKEKKP